MLRVKFAKQTSMRTNYKELEDFSALERTRFNNKKRKNVSSKEERQVKQQQIKDCANAKFSLDDPRHVRFTNSTASIICTDAIPTNAVNCGDSKML